MDGIWEITNGDNFRRSNVPAAIAKSSCHQLKTHQQISKKKYKTVYQHLQRN
jgi:hypothetical protein